MNFGGETYSPEFDGRRLVSQFNRVKELMIDGEWRTLPQIKASVGGSEAGISARLRDLRKEQFGSFLVKRRRIGDGKAGTWQYQVIECKFPYIIEENGQAAFL